MFCGLIEGVKIEHSKEILNNIFSKLYYNSKQTRNNTDSLLLHVALSLYRLNF